MTNLQTQPVSCPGCHRTEAATVTKVFSSPIRIMTDLVRCQICGLAYLNPRPSLSHEKTFYEKEYFERADFREWKDNRTRFFQFALNKIEASISERKLLDVGCGGGFFLDLARSHGWEVTGIELSEAAIRHARESLDLSVIQAELKNSHFPPNEFSVVTLWNVLDQMWDPAEQLEEIFQVIKPGGLLVLRVSNATFHLGLHRFLGFLKSVYLIPRDQREPTVFHLCMFDTVSIKHFLQTKGFTETKISNSPLDAEPQVLVALLGPTGSRIVTRLCYALAKVLHRITGKVLGPSLFVTTRKSL
ncbi:MAG: class I SAM-dependent methyltransferase [Candidatus Omnitrophica bacterium]|nr:class I SAM-dependent methyltransferase [Candidatus Omnitrophota bacterium]